METKFNFRSQVCTSIEQSRRLLELGLKKETADMIHVDYGGRNYMIRLYDWLPTSKVDMEKYIPAWSFSRLLEIYLTSGVYRNILFVNKEDSFENLLRHVEVYIKAGYIDENYLTEDYGTRGLQD